MKNTKFKFRNLFLFFLLGSLIFPFFVLADGEYKADGTNVCYQGLVPCGKAVSVGGQLQNGSCVGGSPQVLSCQFCHLFVMFDGIVDLILFRIVPAVAVLMLVIGGFMFMFAYFSPAQILPGGARGGPTLLSQARRLITSVVIGLVIIFTSWLIINSILTFPGLMNPNFGWDPTKWFQVDCPIKLQ